MDTAKKTEERKNMGGRAIREKFGKQQTIRNRTTAQDVLMRNYIIVSQFLFSLEMGILLYFL
jgi:urease alpha subunit